MEVTNLIVNMHCWFTLLVGLWYFENGSIWFTDKFETVMGKAIKEFELMLSMLIVECSFRML